MTDKVQKIREEVVRLRNLHQMKYQQLDINDNMCLVECGKRNLCNELLSFIDSLQEEPVSYELEKVVEEIVEPTILNAYGTKELARRLRNTICGTSVSEELENAAFDYAEACKYEGGEKLLCVEHFKAGAKWQFNQLEKNRLKHCNSITNEQAELEQGFIDQHLDKHQRMPTFLDAIEYGMRLQKEQDIKHGYVTFLQGEKHFANYILEMINNGWHIVAIKTACNDKIKED